MELGKQLQSVALKRGLFIVRYATAEDHVHPPRVEITVDPASAKDIGLFLHPDHDEAVLWQPDACLVVRAEAPGTLAVQVVASKKGGSVAATVRIEPLVQGEAAGLVATRTANLGAPASGGVRILGHVTGIGDVLVKPNEWIAGPSAPSRIEGISIDWPDKPADLDIHYAVKTAKPQPISGRRMELGSFAGTRGKAMPLVSLMFEVSGAAAADHQLTVEAIFLGAPATRLTGKRIVASGPTGREPLVGLRIGLQNDVVVSHPAPKPAATKPTKPTGRVRVFRSRPNVKESAKA